MINVIFMVLSCIGLAGLAILGYALFTVLIADRLTNTDGESYLVAWGLGGLLFTALVVVVYVKFYLPGW